MTSLLNPIVRGASGALSVDAHSVVGANEGNITTTNHDKDKPPTASSFLHPFARGSTKGMHGVGDSQASRQSWKLLGNSNVFVVGHQSHCHHNIIIIIIDGRQ